MGDVIREAGGRRNTSSAQVEPIVQDGWATYVAPDILECLRKASAEGPTSLFDPPPLCCMHGLRAGTVGKLRRVKERIL
jgi:hypothetical protein